MNGSRQSNSVLIEAINKASIPANIEVLVAPPYVYLTHVQAQLSKNILLAAQNAHSEAKGAFTGEVSPNMLKDLGIDWVVLGHSERRHGFGESNEFVGKKVLSSVNLGLSVIFCCGELLKERQEGKTEHIVFEQLAPLKALGDNWSKVVIAYEPVWAIGTGVVATPQQAQDTQAAIRNWLSQNVSVKVASETRIIYGGSVKPDNCEELSKQKDIDGFLVGGASLVANDFLGIISASEKGIKNKNH